MELLAYGEDSLTLWALTNKLPIILQKLGDSSPSQKIKVFYRPSFGRSGKPSFGEFDFIILSQKNLYLGESKWKRQKTKNSTYTLSDVQLLRHQIFTFYATEWLAKNYPTWKDFEEQVNEKFQEKFNKPIVPSGRTLANNLQTVLQIIEQHFQSPPSIINVLLFLHSGINRDDLPQSTNGTFNIIDIDYSNDTLNNYIKLNI